MAGRTWWERVLGPFPARSAVPLEDRLFPRICAVTAWIGLLVVPPINALQHLSPWLNLPIMSFGLASLAIYLAARRGHPLVDAYFLLAFLTLDSSWLLDGGSTGSIGAFFFPLLMALMIFYKGRGRGWMIGLFLANSAALLWVERRFPALVVPFGDAGDRYWDLQTGYVVCTLTCVLILALVLEVYHRERERLRAANLELERSFSEIRTLQGLLPICSWCKKIRDDEGFWTRIEDYLGHHTDATFTHGMCPDCQNQHFPPKAGPDPGP